MTKLRWLLCLCLLSQVVFQASGQTAKLDPGNKKYFLEVGGVSFTKSIYDTIIIPSDSWSTVITKTEEGYGLLYAGNKKVMALLPNEFEYIQHYYFEGYFVQKNGKYAQYQAMDNLDMDDNDKAFFITKTPVFRTAFLYDKVKVVSQRVRLYHEYGDEWKTWNYGVVWQGDRTSMFNFNMRSSGISSKSFACNDVVLFNIDTKPFFKIQAGNKFGIVDEEYNVQLPAVYDSITYRRIIFNVPHYKDKKITNDYLILHQAGKMYLANFTRGTNYLNHNFLIESYHVDGETMYFTENGKSMKLVEGQKIAADFEVVLSDKYEHKLIKKDKRYGLMAGDKILLEPVYVDYEWESWCDGEADVYFFRKEQGDPYVVYSGRYKEFMLKTEKISAVDCTSDGLYLKRADGKWYSLIVDKFHYLGKPEVGYDSLGSLMYPSEGILGYRNGKTYHISGAGDYAEVSIPHGAKYVTHIPETDGFVYKINEKFGYNNQTITFAPVLDNLNMGYDKKAGSTLFSTNVEGKEYLFYPADFDQDQSIRSFVDCQECFGFGFFLRSETETRTIKGSTTTRSERVFLWRDGEYVKTTTTVEPDREVTTSNTVHEPCPACSGTGKKRIRLRSLAGQVQVD